MGWKILFVSTRKIWCNDTFGYFGSKSNSDEFFLTRCVTFIAVFSCFQTSCQLHLSLCLPYIFCLFTSQECDVARCVIYINGKESMKWMSPRNKKTRCPCCNCIHNWLYKFQYHRLTQAKVCEEWKVYRSPFWAYKAESLNEYAYI